MKRFGLTPLLVLAAVTTAVLVGARFAPLFPGDLELARFIQRVAPPGDWARAVTRAAYVPWVYGVLAVSAVAALRVAGWRGAVAVAVTFFALMHGEHYIKDHIARPRPPAALLPGGSDAPMAMMGGGAMPGGGAGKPSYGMPSGWALLFGASVGAVGALALRNTHGVARAAYVTGALVVLGAGLAARVSLGQHWPSDVMAGYLLAIALALFVYEALAAFTSRGFSRTSKAPQSSRRSR